MLELLTRVYITRMKIGQKISSYKISKVIKSRDFDTCLLSLGAPERKKFEGFSAFTSIPVKCDDKDCLVKAKGSFKILEHNNKRTKSYSLGLRTDENNRKWWESLEAKIHKLSTPALKKLAKPGDFVLIKTNQSGYSNVYVKVYEKSCKFKSLVDG